MVDLYTVSMVAVFPTYFWVSTSLLYPTATAIQLMPVHLTQTPFTLPSCYALAQVSHWSQNVSYIQFPNIFYALGHDLQLVLTRVKEIREGPCLQAVVRRLSSMASFHLVQVIAVHLIILVNFSVKYIIHYEINTIGTACIYYSFFFLFFVSLLCKGVYTQVSSFLDWIATNSRWKLHQYMTVYRFNSGII